MRLISAGEAPGGINAVGHIRLDPKMNGRRPRERKEIASLLRQEVRAGNLKRKNPSGRDQTVEELRGRLVNHPCHACPRREMHAATAHKWVRANREYERLAGLVVKQTDTLGTQYRGVTQILEQLGYLHCGKVTAAGFTLAGIYSERDLLLAQCIRHDIFTKLSPAELAGAIALCIYTPRTDRVQNWDFPTQLAPLVQQVADLQVVISSLEEKQGLPVMAPVDAGLVAAIFAWVNGASLATALESVPEMSAGDFVRWAKIILDVLGQIRVISAQLAPTARKATELIRRGVVAWSEL
ncbi:MAG: hypothetical protein Q4A71_00790 [Actinomycetaceae bacterium]|nr:hypothetical protein [Actinomycetaceae bacterium]